RLVSSEGVALVVAGLYAFATTTLSVGSQALWEHGPATLSVALALWGLARRDARGTGAAAFALAAAVFMRPTNVLLAIPLAAVLLQRTAGAGRSLLAWSAPPLAALAAYNTWHFGTPWSSGRDATLTAPWWSADPLAGLAGLLLSPGRGLFVYSPVLILGVAGLAAGWRRGRPLFAPAAAGVALFVAACAFRQVWWGGYCYGPRMLADLAPLLAFGLVPVAEAAATRPRVR